MNIHSDITSVIGQTPLVRLNHMALPDDNVIVKLEYQNPGGSVKDRIGVAIIDAAEKSGQLLPGGLIVEGTSGNTGIALAMVAAARGYEVCLTMPSSMSIERQMLLKGYGAELILTDPSLGMRGANEKAKKIADERGGVLASQFTNEANPEIHRLTTAKEILTDTEGKIDILVTGIGTGGTITGVGQVLKAFNPEIKIIGVEPKESPILNGGSPGPHRIQGIGANLVPEILDREVYNEIIDVDADTAIARAREAARSEGLLVGISSGAVLEAALQIANRPENKGKMIVAILASNGERYLTTDLFKDLI